MDRRSQPSSKRSCIEIHEQTRWKAGQLQIGDDLRRVYGMQALDCLDFDNQAIVHNQIDLEWGNQAFREMTIAAVTDGHIVHIEPGLNELGFSGLARRTDVAAVRHYHLLWALTFAAIPLALFTLSIAARVRHTVARALLILVTVFAYDAILWVSDSSLRRGAPVPVAWAPNVVFLATGLMLLWRQWAISEPAAETPAS